VSYVVQRVTATRIRADVVSTRSYFCCLDGAVAVSAYAVDTTLPAACVSTVARATTATAAALSTTAGLADVSARHSTAGVGKRIRSTRVISLQTVLYHAQTAGRRKYNIGV